MVILSETFQLLYSKEINCGIQSRYDTGWMAWIGDPTGDRYSEERNLKLEDIPNWLIDKAMELFPGAF